MRAACGLPGMTLQPGELYIARDPSILQTILGSCVGVTIWSARLGVGAMCHGVLPRCPLNWPSGSTLADGHRYVDFSIRYLAQQFDALGVQRRDLQVKLFGGADVLPVTNVRNGRLTVGAQNCNAAVETLSQEGLIVLASDLGGSRGRTIHFHTGTGEVLVHRLAHWRVRNR
jgi:chemotaxis protein CheD